MSGYTFEGQHFRTLAAWNLAFPAYRTYPDLLKAGAETVLDMEKAIHARRIKGRAASLKACREGVFAAQQAKRMQRRGK